MNEKLKPCPFCGGEHISVQQPALQLSDVHFVCLNCWATVNFLSIKGAPTTAAEAWNRRDGDYEKDSRIEALESWLRIANTYACNCCVGCQALGLNNTGTENCLYNNGKNWVFDWERFAPSKEDDKPSTK